MTKKSTKSALLTSSISLLLCFAMLLGTTFAWFTDSVTSANNIIKSGNLDVTFEYWDGDSWETVQDASDILTNTLWEPGVAEVAYLKVANKGSLALKYQLGVNIVSETEGENVEGDTFKLSDYLKFGVVENVNGETNAYANREAAVADVTHAKALNAGYFKDEDIAKNEAKQEHYFALVVWMPTTVDNEANHNGTVPKIDLGLNVVATQLNAEKDSFGSDYDADVKYPVSVSTADELTAALKEGGNIVLAENIDLTKTLFANGDDVVLDLNGKTITAPSSGAMFHSGSDTDPSMIITSSTDGAVINAGSNAVLLGYGSTEISNVTINVENATSTSVPFSVYGNLTLGEGTVVNVNKLGTSLISNNGAVAIVIDGAKINVGEFKVNGATLIALNQASTLEMKKTAMKIDNFVLSQFGGEGLVNKIAGVTIENCTFDVTDSNGASCTFVADAGLGRYDLVQK